MHRLVIRTLVSLFVLLVMLIPFFVTAKTGAARANAVLVRLSFWLGCIIWGIRVKQEGRLSGKRPLLMVSNHFSYIDVFALGSATEARFTPKSEIAGWPMIGLFCKITGCIFIDRRRAVTMHNKKKLAGAIKDNCIISLFPEGTTNEGTALLPFKSSFFSIAEEYDLTVQPVSLVYKKLNGEPITAETRHIVGWYGNAEFFPHLVTFLQQKSVDVTVIFHKTVNGKDFSSRKELASYCRDVIGSS